MGKKEYHGFEAKKISIPLNTNMMASSGKVCTEIIGGWMNAQRGSDPWEDCYKTVMYPELYNPNDYSDPIWMGEEGP